MKAARWYKARDIRVEEVTDPRPGPGQVKIKVRWTGICGSDLHEYAAGPITIPVDAPHPLTGKVAPVIMGHEFSGEVVALGEGAERFAVGDRVVVEPILACGKCDACRHGKYNLCETMGLHGMSGDGGGFATYTTIAEACVHKMPDGLSFEQGALVEPAAVALHAVRQSSLKAGGTAAVFGAGPIGLLIVEALRAAGASAIHVVELSPQRAAKAKELGASSVINPSTDNAVEVIRALTNGGVDVAFEVTGVPAVLRQCIEATRYAGETMIVSLWEKDASFQPNAIVMKEKTITSSICYRDVFPAVMELMLQGYFPADTLVTKRIELDDIVAEGFETLIGEKTQVKILVRSPD